MPSRNGRIHIQRIRAEGYPEVHLETDGTLAEGPGRPTSASDEEKIAVYDRILAAVGLVGYDDEEDVDAYRRKMVADVVAAAKDLGTLDEDVLSSTTVIPPAYNRIRGEIFELWVQEELGAVGPGPVFASKSLGKDKVRRIADLTTAEGDRLIEAKALTEVRNPQEEEIDQMRDYGKILGRVKGYLTATGVGRIYNQVLYVFNKPELPAKWKPALRRLIGEDRFSTWPES
jgi:hypothetical protein